MFDEVARFDYQNSQSIFRQGSILQVHSMLAERAHSEKAKQPVHRLARICFSFLYAWLTLLAGFANVHFAVAGDQHEVASPIAATSGEVPQEQAVVTPQADRSELYPPTSLRFESDDSAFILWQPPTLASSRVIPRGLVLSFLCDSARHQRSGVQLA